MDIDRLLDILNPYTIQERGEMRWLFEKVNALAPQNILEIGRAMGGSAALFAATGAHVITVDNVPQGPYAWTRADYLALVPEPQITQIDEDAHLDATYADVLMARRLSGNGVSFDVVFIDGGHHHEDAARDFLMYAGLARPGGMIVLHDIVSPHPEEAWWPKWFWTRVRGRGWIQTDEFTALDGADGGMGVIYMPRAPSTTVPKAWTIHLPRWLELTELAQGLVI